jgi:hypothetical protein
VGRTAQLIRTVARFWNGQFMLGRVPPSRTCPPVLEYQKYMGKLSGAHRCREYLTYMGKPEDHLLLVSEFDGTRKGCNRSH